MYLANLIFFEQKVGFAPFSFEKVIFMKMLWLRENDFGAKKLIN